MIFKTKKTPPQKNEEIKKIEEKTEKKDMFRKAVGALIMNPKQQFYFFRRGDFPDCWQSVEGGIDSDETEEVAIYREIKEEIGVNKNKLKFIMKMDKSFTYLYPPEFLKIPTNGDLEKIKYIGQKKQFFLFEYRGQEKDLLKEQLVYKDGYREFTDWKLVDKKQAIELVPDFKKEFYKQIFKELRL
jgi:putative (di)nucleoside polyphosphate hydrolase